MDDTSRASALSGWAARHSGSPNLSLELRGPFEAAGQDPVYVLRLEGPHRDGEVLLFRGGLVMMHSFDKIDSGSEMEVRHLDGVSAEQLAAMLDVLADRL